MVKLEIKTIKGNKYLYIKDKVRVNSKNLSITMYVGRFEKTGFNAFVGKLAQFLEVRLTKYTEYWMRKDHYYLTDYQLTVLERLHLDYCRFQRYYPDETKVYEDNVYTRYVAGTTAIEGNTITQIEAEELIEHGVTPAGKSIREVYEIMNFNKLRKELQSYSGDVTEEFIKRIHEILMWDILNSPGVYRRIQVLIEKARHEPPPAFEVEELMEELVKWYVHNKDKMHPFELAVLLHTKFVSIHPFIDGNGRVARALMNFVLGKNGYPTLYFGLEERNAYLDAVAYGNDEVYQKIVDFMYGVYQKQHGQVMDDIWNQKPIEAFPDLRYLAEQFLIMKENG